MKLLSLAVVAFLLSQGVQAGEILRFKAGGAIKPAVTSLLPSQETGLYVVQWKKAVKESEKASLKQLGLQILSYVPDDAFLVQGDFRQAAEASSLSFVRVVLPYEAQFKMEPELTHNGIFGFQSAARVTVELAKNADVAAVKAALSSVTDVGGGLLVGEADVGTLWQLAQRSDVV